MCAERYVSKSDIQIVKFFTEVWFLLQFSNNVHNSSIPNDISALSSPMSFHLCHLMEIYPNNQPSVPCTQNASPPSIYSQLLLKISEKVGSLKWPQLTWKGIKKWHILIFLSKIQTKWTLELAFETESVCAIARSDISEFDCPIRLANDSECWRTLRGFRSFRLWNIEKNQEANWAALYRFADIERIARWNGMAQWFL